MPHRIFVGINLHMSELGPTWEDPWDPQQPWHNFLWQRRLVQAMSIARHCRAGAVAAGLGVPRL